MVEYHIQTIRFLGDEMKKLISIFLLLTALSTVSNAASKTINDNEGIDINGIMYYKSDLTPFTGRLKFHKDRSYYKNGKPHGKWLTFYPNGNLKSIENWKEGELVGKFVLYQNDGSKIFETIYLNGKDNGDYYLYHNNGKVQVQGRFLNGVPKGTWKYYNDKGKLTGKAQY